MVGDGSGKNVKEILEIVLWEMLWDVLPAEISRCQQLHGLNVLVLQYGVNTNGPTVTLYVLVPSHARLDRAAGIARGTIPVDYIAKDPEDYALAGQDLSRRRFSRSLPRVSSVLSIEYEKSERPSPSAQLQDKESKELKSSWVDAQLMVQIDDELGHIRAARDEDLRQHPLFDLEEPAETNVKYRWIHQGIWDERWASQPGKKWKRKLQDLLTPVRPSDSVKERGATNS